jgi:hypothetical protein
MFRIDPTPQQFKRDVGNPQQQQQKEKIEEIEFNKQEICCGDFPFFRVGVY